LTSWASITPARVSAFICKTVPASVTGAVAPLSGSAGTMRGMPLSATWMSMAV
jgi:hypothetical protein